jgi:hypothetical protein
MNSAQIPVNRLRISQHKIAGANTPLRNKMKLSIKQRIRNWLMDDSVEECYASVAVEQDRLGSEGMRLQIHKASGGFVVETRNYDQRKDQSKYTMYVITEEQDLGESLGKIVMMEALRG